LFLSVLFGFAGIFSEYIYTIDWWRPLTITGTRVGLEDFLFGFWAGGVSGIIYEEVFKRRLYLREKRKSSFLLHFLCSMFSVGILFFGSFYILQLSSFYSSILAMGLTTLFIWILRKDLILDSLLTGIIVPLVGLLWFWIPEYFTPGWVENHWLFENLSGIVILKAPLEDLIWGFFAGTFIGPLYEFWQGARLVKYK